MTTTRLTRCANMTCGKDVSRQYARANAGLCQACVKVQASNAIAAANAETAGYHFTHVNAEGYACYDES
jgi:hypothetical protein